MPMSVISNAFLLHQIRHYVNKDAPNGRKVLEIWDSGELKSLLPLLLLALSDSYILNYFDQRNGGDWRYRYVKKPSTCR